MPFWSENRLEHIPAGDGHNTVNSQGAFWTHIPGRCHHVLEVCTRAFGPPMDWNRITVESQSIIETEGVFEFGGPYGLLEPGNPGSRHRIPTKATDAICRLQEPANMTEHKPFPGLWNVLRRFELNYACTATLLNQKMEKDQYFYFGRLNETGINVLEALQDRLPSPPR